MDDDATLAISIGLALNIFLIFEKISKKRTLGDQVGGEEDTSAGSAEEDFLKAGQVLPEGGGRHLAAVNL